MEISVTNIINEVTELEIFDLKTYYDYIHKYGNKVMLQVFDEIFQNAEDIELVLEKYFDVYFSIELESIEINDRTYIKLANKYGEDKINNYFNSLLSLHANPKLIKEKYSPIYFYIETINTSQQDDVCDLKDVNVEDSVKLYLKEIGEYKLLTETEEKQLLQTLNYSRQNVEIAAYDELDNFQIIDINKLINSIKTKEQFKKLTTIFNYLADSAELDKDNKEVLAAYIENMKLYFKKNEIVKNHAKNQYDETYVNEQLDLMINFIKSREVLIKANLRLVVSIAKHYGYGGVGLLDLISEGNIGLMKAIKKFDCSKTTKLSTYATWWIRQSVTRYTADNCRTIRIPVHFNEKIGKYNQAHKQITLEYGENPTIEQLAKATGYTETEIKEIQNVIYKNTYVSLDGHVGDDEDSEVIDFIPDTTNIEDIVSKKMLAQVFADVLDTLPVREREVLKYRYGFYGRNYTLEEVGQMYGVTRERIRQIENKTIRKLRHPSRARKIRDFIEKI